ncbi:MAG: thioredoxin domain-containing protein [Anaerolineae bacterium]|nr:thioredoxin domain-containing protein [Anaerolineae bacterium]
MRRIVIALLIVSVLVVGSPLVSRAQTPTETPNKIAVFWDMGITVGYPADWGEQIITGQMYLSPPTQASEHPIKQPFVALRIFDPIRDLGLLKDATYEQIAAALSLSSGTNATVTQSAATTFAGLEAWLLLLESEVKISADETVSIRGEMIVFLLPDGRYGAFVGNSPSDQYGDFSVIQSAVIRSASLILPKDYTPPVITTQTSSFPQGGVQFAIPDNWRDQEEQGVDARTYFDQSLTPYSDSGLVNGPALQVIAVPMPEGGKLDEALLAFLGSPLPTKMIVLNGTIQAVEVNTINPINWQTFIFVAFLSQDGKVVNIFRWTTPGMLAGKTRPIFDAILASIKLNSGTTVSAVTPTVVSIAPPDYVSLQGIPVTNTADGSPIIGSPTAPVKIVDYMDYGCEPCGTMAPLIHDLVTGYVREGKVSLELRYLTVVGGAYAATASYAALCAGEQNKQLEMHDLLFYIHRTTGIPSLTADTITQQAGRIPGLDVIALRACMDSGKYTSVLDANRKLASEFKLNAVPTLFIVRADAPTDYQQIAVPQTLSDLTSIIDQFSAKN